MTSNHEGLPMILLEAMALKVPVIAHAVGGIPNLLAQGECGLLVEEHAAQGYADTLYRLYMNPDERTEITNRAFSRVTQMYSAGKNADKYYMEYKKLMQ
jgi:glycosyltransferase involved in cell wall biosynthesis